jgi:hypothetical protein
MHKTKIWGNKMNAEIKSLLLNAACGFAVCIIIGLLFFGPAIFKSHNTSFIIIADGFYGAVFYSVLKYNKYKEQLFTGFAIVLLNILLPGISITIIYLIQTILMVSALIGAIICYKLFLDKYNTYPLFIRSLALPVFLVLFNILIILILVLYFQPDKMMVSTAMLIEVKFAVCTGLGLGIGFDLFEKFKSAVLI